MKRLLQILLLTTIIFANDQIPGSIQKHPILLKGGILHTISGDVLRGYDLLFANGKIIRIDEEIIPSPETEVIDIYNTHVTPGFIVPVSQLGLVEIGQVKQSRDFAEIGKFNPNVRANVSYNPDSEIIPVTRSNGILLANVAPSSGRISGQSSLMMLDGWTWKDATMLHPTALHINWPNMRIRTGKKVKEKEKVQKEKIQKEIQALDDWVRNVKAYEQRISVHLLKSDEKQIPDIRLASMIPFINGEKPIFIRANEIRQIKSAIRWGNKHHLDIVIVGGRDAWRASELLVKFDVPVILQNVLSTPMRRFEPIHLPYEIPKILSDAGVQFCIAPKTGYPHNGNIRNLPYEAAMAVRHGLPKEEGLRAITLSAAEILGVADKIGSLEPGKDATFFLSNRNPLEITSSVSKAFIQGREIDLGDRQKSLYEKYKEKYRQLGKLEQ
jgi:imidazolonepropionase-like amidohydrolase